MNLKRIVSRITNSLPLFVLLIVFTYSRWELDGDLHVFPLNVIEGGILFAFGLEVIQSILKRKVVLIPLVLFTFSLTLGILVSHPAMKSRDDAKTHLDDQYAAAEIGVDLGERVVDNEITKEDAYEEIKEDKDITDENKSIAEQSVDATVDEFENVEEVKQDVVPTIPLEYKKWSCNSHGCSFLDDDRVWQITWHNRIAGTLIVLMSMGMMIAVSRKQ